MNCNLGLFITTIITTTLYWFFCLFFFFAGGYGITNKVRFLFPPLKFIVR